MLLPHVLHFERRFTDGISSKAILHPQRWGPAMVFGAIAAALAGLCGLISAYGHTVAGLLLVTSGYAVGFAILYRIGERRFATWSLQRYGVVRGTDALPEYQAQWVKEAGGTWMTPDVCACLIDHLERDMQERRAWWNPIISFPGVGLVGVILSMVPATFMGTPVFQRLISHMDGVGFVLLLVILCATVAYVLLQSVDGRWTIRRELIAALRRVQTEHVLISMPTRVESEQMPSAATPALQPG